MTDDVEKILNEAGYETERLDTASERDGPIWGCKIGLKKGTVISLPGGSDAPMRQAVEEAFKSITGLDADFCFSGWGEKLTQVEELVVAEG